MDIKLENFPPALEWLKKTGPKNTFSGSYSRNRTFFETSFNYRIWSTKNPETDERELNVSCWIRPAGGGNDQTDYAESKAAFSQEGLQEIGAFLTAQIGSHPELFA